MAVGGELVALEPGGTPGCRLYETALPRYADPIDGGAATRAEGTPGGFVPNRGQLPGSVLFAARAADHALAVRATGATLTTAGGAVELRVRGASDGAPGQAPS